MSKLYRTDGTIEDVKPLNGFSWSLPELQTMVGDYVEVQRTCDGRLIVLDENGKLKRKPLNRMATMLYIHGRRDPIVGDALVIDTRKELGEDDEPQQ